jgi:hypothetical protein
MKNKALLFIVITLVLLLISGGVVFAQEGTAGDAADEDAQNPVLPNPYGIVVPGAIPVQGRLTDASGRPLNGSFSVTFSLYDVDTGGTALCTQTHSVTVTNGLFNSYLDNCYNDLFGQKVWMGVKVGADPEMTPRQVIYPVPYALTLKPMAMIKGDVDGVLTIVGTAGAGTTADYDGFLSYAVGGGEAVSADAENGYGVFATSLNNVGIVGMTENIVDPVPGIIGCVDPNLGNCAGYMDNNPAGVIGYSNRGDGLQGYASDIVGRGVYATNSDGGTAIAAYSTAPSTPSHLYPTLYLIQGDATGDFLVGAGSYFGTRYWRVDRTGKGFFNGGTQASGADFAEQIAVEGPEAAYQPGDVMVISPDADRVVELSTKAYDTTVLGVYSTQPAMLAGAPDTNDPLKGVPVAVVGIVKCKVSAENGPIHRGDLLVTASKPGHAMRAGANPPQGTVLGKAMQNLESGTGEILILVTLQ